MQFFQKKNHLLKLKQIKKYAKIDNFGLKNAQNQLLFDEKR
jgi:hypothetical protein